MDPATIAILLGSIAASSAASVYTNQQNIRYAQEANEESVNLANTAHQREVRDLQAAGLNPILSARGSGADVPQLKTPDLENPLEQLGSSAGTLANAFNGLTKSQVKTAQAEANSAEHTEHILKNEKVLSDSNRTLATHRLAADNVEEAARFEALTGIGSSEVQDMLDYGDNPKARKAYRNIVKQYRRELSTGAYQAGRWRAITSDVQSILGTVINGAGAVNQFMPRTTRRIPYGGK